MFSFCFIEGPIDFSGLSWGEVIQAGGTGNIMSLPRAIFAVCWSVGQEPSELNTLWHPQTVLFSYKLPVPVDLGSCTQLPGAEKGEDVQRYETWQHFGEIHFGHWNPLCKPVLGKLQL